MGLAHSPRHGTLTIHGGKEYLAMPETRGCEGCSHNFKASCDTMYAALQAHIRLPCNNTVWVENTPEALAVYWLLKE